MEVWNAKCAAPPRVQAGAIPHGSLTPLKNNRPVHAPCTGRITKSRKPSRGARIRTGDPLLPKQVRYRTAPRPEVAAKLIVAGRSRERHITDVLSVQSDRRSTAPQYDAPPTSKNNSLSVTESTHSIRRSRLSTREAKKSRSIA